MAKSPKKPPVKEPHGIRGSVEAIEEVDDGFELAIRIQNPLNRTIHYISDVRGMIFDTSNRHLRVQLSDQGREMPPGGILMEPRFRMVDPNSEALLTIRLPKTIVKLSSVSSPTGEVILEKHAIAEADEIEIEIGWADTPYYRDPREKSRGASPISSWEQQSLHIAYKPHFKAD